MAKPQPQLKPKKKKKSTSTNGNNNKAPPSYFFPNSPTTVGSPKDNGFYLRQVRQRTPNKLCTLVLPPPLISLFDPNANGDVAAAAGATNHRISVAASSDNASLDGTSIIDNAQAHSSSSVRHQHQIQHNNQGQGGGAYNISSNASAVSASVASVGGGNNAVVGQHHNPHLPLHLRVGMASCDPLIVFDGRFVLAATCDGRIAIYSIVDFDTTVSGVSDDVMASERRRCAEWKEEDDDGEQSSDDEEEKKDEPKGQTTKTLSSERDTTYEILPDAPSVQEEESEWDMRDRMHRRERAKQLVEPMLIVTLPKTNYGPTDSGHDQSQPMNSSSSSIKHDEESSIVGTVVHGGGGIATPPAIVAMCATPGTGESLVEQRDIVNDDTAATTTEGQTNKASVNTFKEGHCIPTFGASLLGHVAVLTDDGEVHVIEILENKTTSRMSDSHGSDMANINNHPTANTIVSFRTGHLSATCICMHQLPSTVSPSNQQAMHLRLCVGHQSGILAAFQVYSTLVYPRAKKDRASPKQNVSSVKYFQGEECQQGSSGVDPLDVSYSKSQRHHLRANTTDLTNLLGQLSSSPAVSPEKSTPRISNYRSAPNTENSKANKSLHRTYGFHRTCSEPIASFDPGKNEAPPVIGPAKVLLCWKGRYDTPVKAVSSPGWEQTTERTENAKVQDALLVVGIEQCQREDPSQSSMKAVSPDSSSHYSLSPAISLEVMNATLAEQFWDQIKQSEPFDPYKCISLYDCSVWPAAGKEIKDGWMRGSSMRRGVDPRDKLFGMLGLQRTSVTNKLCELKCLIIVTFVNILYQYFAFPKMTYYLNICAFGVSFLCFRLL